MARSKKLNAEQREEARELNKIAMSSATHEGKSVTRDINALGHAHDPLVKHDLSMFTQIMEGVHGLNIKGRLLYNLNFMAQRILRDCLRDATKNEVLDDTLSSLLTDEELSAMFGFESKPLYTLDKAIHWTMVTYILAHDVSQYTEADRNGMKSKPFAWINDLIRNPFTMVASDAVYSVKASVDNQSVQLEKFGYRAKAAESIEKFAIRQKAQAEDNVREKIALLKQNCDVHHYKNLGTDEALGDLEEMIADLGLNIPTLVVEIAQKYLDSLTQKADEGRYLGDVDEQIIALLPKTVFSRGESAAAPAEYVADPDTDVHTQVTGTMRRVKREDVVTPTTH